MIEMIEASPMRLTPEQIDTIRATIRETFGSEAHSQQSITHQKSCSA